VYHAKFVVFEEARKRLNTSPTEFPPENRLYGAMIGSGILPTGLFWFAWTARRDIHWICPVIAQAITIPGSLLIYISASLYMMDTYGPLWRFCNWRKLALAVYPVGSISTVRAADVQSIGSRVGDEPSRIPHGRHGTYTVGVLSLGSHAKGSE
jgi:hypothetical protein